MTKLAIGGYCFLERGTEETSLRARLQPAVNLEPEPLFGLCTRHHAHVSTIQHTELLVLAADQAHDGFSLGYAADDVLCARNTQQRARDVLEVDGVPPQLELPFHELIVLNQVVNHLPERLAGEGNALTHPLVEGDPGGQRRVLAQAVPPSKAGAEVVGGQLEQAGGAPDEFGGHVPKERHEPLRANSRRGDPAKVPQVLGGAVNGGGVQNQVPEGRAWEEGRVHGAEQAPDAGPKEADRLAVGSSEDLLDRLGKIVEHIVVERENVILVARNPPVEQIDIETLLDQILHEAVAWDQIQDKGPIDERIDQQQGDREPGLPLRDIAVECGLVPGPDHLLGRLAGRDPGSRQQEVEPQAVIPEGLLNGGD